MTRRREHAFTIVEVVIAALVLAIVVVGATALIGSTSRSMSSARVRDVETSVANKVLSIVQADPSWTRTCHSDNRPFTNANARCDITGWVQQEHPGVGNVQEAGQTLGFTLTAVATGIDLETDLTGPADRDGLRPDIYRIDVSVSPDASLAQRFPTLRPASVRAELNPSARVETGRITIDACIATNQVDERMPVASCYGQAYDQKMLPPGSLDLANVPGTCDGPAAATAGSDERDCSSYKCADPDIAIGSGVGCESRPGWRHPSTWSGIERIMTAVAIQPASGSIRLRSLEDGSVHGPVSLQNGRAAFTNLPIGEFEITANISGSWVKWPSKSVPSTNIVASEPGLNSRAVLLFRPPATGAVTFRVSSLDITVPWNPVPYQGWIGLTPDGAVIDGGPPVKLCLVPVPQGRLVADEVPCIEVPRGTSTTEFPFRNVPPGLYAPYIADPSYVSFMPLDNSGGFIYVPASGPAITAHGPTSEPVEYVETVCAKNVRDGMVGQINPETGTPVTSCSSPTGPAPPGGSSGLGGM